MIENSKYLVMDDVVYSTQYATLALMFSILVKYNDKPEDFKEDEKYNLLLTKEIVDRVLNDDNIFLKDTIFNIAMTRPEWDYLKVPNDYQEWLLSHFYELSEIPIKVSPIINIIGSPEVTIVYDDKSLIEKLILKKLNIDVNRLKSVSMTELTNILNTSISKYTNKHSRPSIFTADVNILDKFHKDYAMIVPKIYRWNDNKYLAGFVENWILDNTEKTQKETGGNKDANSEQSC